MAKKSWFQTGKAGREQSKREDKAAAKRREQGGSFPFRLKNDESAKIVFLDNPAFFMHQHTIRVDGRWETFTCLKDFDTCPICESGENSAYVCVGTIIDTRVWEDKDGNKRRNQKRPFVAKGKARQTLLRQIERRDDDLTYCVYEMARGSSKTECATGEDFEYLKRLTKAQIKKLAPADVKNVDDWLKPLDYEKLFQPQSAEELREIVGGEAPVGAGDDDTGSDDDDVLSGSDDDDTGSSDFDEDELRAELEEKNRKGLLSFIKANDLEYKPSSKTKDTTVINKIVELMQEKAEEEDDSGDDEGGDDSGDGDIDIDSLI